VAQEGGVPRKLAGILIETRGERALIGVGVNVAHERFHREIEHRAVSLRQLGQAADRLAVLLRLLRSLDESLSASDAALEAAYRAVDRTAGLRMRFATPGGEVEGVVLRCDPSIGLQVRAADGVHALPAATTRVLP
jgi:biotin-(acetyl-CoA carboxylase) ligase